MPFRFSMQKILDYREQLEEDAKIKVSQAQAQKEACDKRNKELVLAIDTAEETRRKQPTMSAAEFWIADQYLRGLKEDLRINTMECTMAKTVLEEAQKVLTLRAIDKKMLVKLKERQLSAWKREEQTKEQHFNDEIATIRYKKAPIC
ncbi:MAG: flagellar export protein FliJ [Desulfovibrionaceae bacterium]|nr:flagellar export protein FliJ [Desulfovibrionaceae bacterium]